LTDERTSPDIDGGWALVVAAAALIAASISSGNFRLFFSSSFERVINGRLDWLAGLYYTFSMYYVELLNDFQSSRALTAWIGSLNNGVFLLGGPIATMMINRIGIRVTIMLGGVITLLGYSLSSIAPNIATLFFSYGVVAAFGCCLNYTGWIMAMSKFFHKKHAVAFSLTQAGVGLGIIVFGPFFQYLISNYGWRGSFLIMGALGFNLTLLGMLVFPQRKFAVHVEQETLIQTKVELKEEEEKFQDPVAPFSVVLRNPCGWLLHLNSFFWLLGTAIVYILLGDYICSKSLEEYYIYMLSTMGIGDLIGRVLTGPIVEYCRIETIVLNSISQLVCAVCILSFLFVIDGEEMIVLGLIFGITFGMQSVLQSLTVRSIFGGENMSQIFGINMFFGGVGILIGPPLAGLLVEAVQSYFVAFLFAGSAELIAAVFSIVCWISVKRKSSVDTKSYF